MNRNKYKLLIVTLLAGSSVVTKAQDVVIADTLVDEQVVQVAFRQVNSVDLLGGVSSINVRKLLEKNYFYKADEDLQAFVGGWNGKSLWGMDDKLILIDGVPRDINNIKPEEIESITFLKSAAAANLYGSHGAKGVILVTTKRGAEQPIQVSARANTGWFVDKSYPEYLGSAEYMHYYNIASQNDGKDAVYSDEDIYNYASGKNKYRYPDVQFYSSDMIKKAYNRSDVSTEIQGGNSFARFYSNISYYRIGSHFKESEAKHSRIDRFDVRGNIDIDITDYIKARIDASATFYNDKTATSQSDYWKNAAQLRPNRISPFIPIEYVDPNATEAQNSIKTMANIVDEQFLAGTQTDKTNIFADMYCAGTRTWTSRQIQYDAALDFNLDPLVQGLSFHTQFAIDFATTYSNSYKDSYATYTPGWLSNGKEDIIVSLTKIGEDKHTGQQQSGDGSSNHLMAFNAHFNYDRTFGDHSIGAIALINGYQKQVSGKYHAESDASLGLNAHYDFAKRYYADFTLSVPHSSKLPKSTWNGFSPSLTIGWNLANESFLEGSIFDELMISASASQLCTDTDVKEPTGNNPAEYYLYVAKYDNGGGWNWSGNESLTSMVSKRGGNSKLDFIKRKEISANLYVSMFEHALTIDASVFKNTMSGRIITTDVTMPSYFKASNPQSTFVSFVNYNNDDRMGFDFSLNYNKSVGSVDLSLGLNGMYYTTKASKRDDSQYNEEYQKREGKYLDGLWGYENLGFFKDQADIDQSPEQTSFGQEIKPGDIKYKDQNGDGKIDKLDRVELGRKGEYGAPLSLGLNFTAKYKDFTLFILGIGDYGKTALVDTTYWWIKGDDKYSAVVRDSWTAENASSATYPRLTTTNGANNFVASDFWTYKKNNFKLAKIQLTYNLPTELFENNKVISKLQVYVSGSNLLTISKERKELERKINEAPDARFYNLGVKLTF